MLIAEANIKREIINRITGRNTSRRGMIKGKTKQERIQKWFEHFKTLLGKSDTDKVNEKEDEHDLEKVLHNLNINDGLFLYE